MPTIRMRSHAPLNLDTPRAVAEARRLFEAAGATVELRPPFTLIPKLPITSRHAWVPNTGTARQLFEVEWVYRDRPDTDPAYLPEREIAVTAVRALTVDPYSVRLDAGLDTIMPVNPLVYHPEYLNGDDIFELEESEPDDEDEDDGDYDVFDIDVASEDDEDE